MTSSLLLDVLDAVLAEAPPTLLPPVRFPPLRHVASRLPPVTPAGFELRLLSDGPIDLQQNVLAKDASHRIAARHFVDLLADGKASVSPGWDHIARFLVDWVDPATPWRDKVEDLWLEFDLDASPEPALPLPAVFIGLSSGVIPGDRLETALEAILAVLLPAPIPPAIFQTVRRCIAACPERGRISHVGLMLSRPGAGVRVNVACVPAERIATYLEAIGWPGSLTRVESLLDRVFPLVDGISLAMDAGARVGPRLGLECFVRERSAPRRREVALLDLLVELGCCSAGERDSLVAWSTVIGPPQGRAPWPTALIVGDIADPDGGISSISTNLNHVKLDVVEGGPLRAKAYLSFRTHRLPATTQGAEAVDLSEHAAHPAAGPTALRRALEHAMEGALGFLSRTRGQTGLWRDFDEQDGGSDEWVSSVVGGSFAAEPRPRSQQEAHSTWRVLERRARSTGGWGWNAVIAPDADTTVWALRLAYALGRGRSGPSRRGRRFLQQHRAPDGGLVTYVSLAWPGQPPEAIRGWTAVHDCVTAAAAALPGKIGVGARQHLRASQQADGSWRPYWWNDPAYATALAAEALAGRGKASDSRRVAAAIAWAAGRVDSEGSVSAEALNGPSPFATAWVIRVLALGAHTDRASDQLERASAWLTRNQRSDGSWTSAADMWVPPRDARPDQIPGDAILRFDGRRIFTTAIVLGALLKAKRCLDGPRDPAMERGGNG